MTTEARFPIALPTTVLQLAQAVLVGWMEQGLLERDLGMFHPVSPDQLFIVQNGEQMRGLAGVRVCGW